MTRSRFWHPARVTKRTQMLYESDQRSPKADYLVALDVAGVDVGYVLTGTRSADTTTVGEGEPGAGFSAVAMYDLVAVPGAGRSFDQEAVESTLYFETGALMAQGMEPSRVVGIKVRGDSMDGTLADDDWVLVDRSNRDVRQEGVFLLLVSGERRIKRVQRLAGGALYLISDNAHYQPEMIKPEEMREVEILGRCEIRIGRVS